jgi:hypothetical protein
MVLVSLLPYLTQYEPARSTWPAPSSLGGRVSVLRLTLAQVPRHPEKRSLAMKTFQLLHHLPGGESVRVAAGRPLPGQIA